MILQELFTSKTKHTVEGDDANHLRWSAEIANRTIVIIAEFETEERYKKLNSWYVTFSQLTAHGYDRYAKTNSGSAAQVLALVRDFLLELIKKPNVDQIEFNSHEESRSSMYKAMVKRLLPAQWTVKTNEFAGTCVFTLRRGKT